MYEEKELAVETEAVSANPESIHDVSGTLTEENGDPIPGATVDIGGQTGVTDENGNFTIPDVPDGYHPVTITDEDGNVLGYTEVEITKGEPGVAENSDGSYTLTAPEDVDLGLELTVTADDRVSVENLADIAPEKPSQPGKSEEPGQPDAPDAGDGASQDGEDGENPQTGDKGQISLWLTLMLASAGAISVTLLAVCRKKAAEAQR